MYYRFSQICLPILIALLSFAVGCSSDDVPSHTHDISEITGDLGTHTHDGADITVGTIDNARLNTGAGNGLDADTVDGMHAADLMGGSSNVIGGGAFSRRSFSDPFIGTSYLNSYTGMHFSTGYSNGPKPGVLFADAENLTVIANAIKSGMTPTNATLAVKWNAHITIDDFEDSAIHASWNITGPGTVTETAGALIIDGTASIGSQEIYWSAANCYQSGNTYFTVYEAEYGTASMTFIVYIFDGVGGSVQLSKSSANAYSASSNQVRKYVSVYFPPGSDECYLSLYEDLGETYDLSSLSGTNRYVGYYCYWNAGTGQKAKIFWLANNASPIASTEGTFRLRADGTNWETTTNGASHTFTNTGTNIEAEYNLTRSAGEVVVVTDWGISWK